MQLPTAAVSRRTGGAQAPKAVDGGGDGDDGSGGGNGSGNLGHHSGGGVPGGSAGGGQGGAKDQREADGGRNVALDVALLGVNLHGLANERGALDIGVAHFSGRGGGCEVKGGKQRDV